MQLAQARNDNGERFVLVIEDDPTQARRLDDVNSVHALALTACNPTHRDVQWRAGRRAFSYGKSSVSDGKSKFASRPDLSWTIP